MLAALPETELAGVMASVEEAPLIARRTLQEPLGQAAHLYFICEGLVSLTMNAGRGEDVEIALVGPEGAIGASLALGIGSPPWRASVQVAGRAWRMPQSHLKPLMEQIWVTFKLQKISPPYVLKYSAEPDAIRAMALHHDLETLTLVTYLNEEFTGGGTYFPRWNYHTGKPKPGSAILYPGGLSHEHEGVAITAGTRYLLCGSFY